MRYAVGDHARVREDATADDQITPGWELAVTAITGPRATTVTGRYVTTGREVTVPVAALRFDGWHPRYDPQADATPAPSAADTPAATKAAAPASVASKP